MMRVSAYVLTALNIIGWAGLTIMGVWLLLDFWHRSAPGYPNIAQIIYYVVFPLALAFVAVGVPAWRILRGAEIGPWSPLLMLIVMFFFVLPYTGGV